MELENKIFNNIEYTLVDKYNWKTKVIYHFAGDESDLFCEKIKNDYKVIKDEKLINDIIDEYDLKEPEVYFSSNLSLKFIRLLGIKQVEKISKEQKQELLKEQISKLSELNCNISKEELEKRLEKVEVCIADWDLAKKEFGAFYYPATNSMFFNQEDIEKDSLSSKRMRLHETIHAISGSKAFASNFFNKIGLIEGATENIVEKLYGEEFSRFESANLQFNFSKIASYPYNVALIRQM